MFKFFSKYRLQLSILAVLIGLLFLMIQTHSQKESSHLQSAIQTFTYPVQASVHSFASSIKNFWYSYLSLIEVKEENTSEATPEEIENWNEFLEANDLLGYEKC